mmetsp:Transcript_13587/g.37731  ORF Transcript_13587/g.37731 Transcript_13587/m.37731 type:complete len:205 (+) Transcript_13587:388-1002(+)
MFAMSVGDVAAWLQPVCSDNAAGRWKFVGLSSGRPRSKEQVIGKASRQGPWRHWPRVASSTEFHVAAPAKYSESGRCSQAVAAPAVVRTLRYWSSSPRMSFHLKAISASHGNSATSQKPLWRIPGTCWCTDQMSCQSMENLGTRRASCKAASRSDCGALVKRKPRSKFAYAWRQSLGGEHVAPLGNPSRKKPTASRTSSCEPSE